MVSLEFRASSFAIGARRAPEAARVDARPSPGPPSIRDGDEASSIAFVSVKSGSCGVGASKNHLARPIVIFLWRLSASRRPHLLAVAGPSAPR